MIVLMVIAAFLLGVLMGIFLPHSETEKQKEKEAPTPKREETPDDELEKAWENLLRYDGRAQEE